jgi:hypothetical protein
MALNHGKNLLKLMFANRSKPNFIKLSSNRLALIYPSVNNYSTSNLDEIKTLNPAKFQKVSFILKELIYLQTNNLRILKDNKKPSA